LVVVAHQQATEMLMVRMAMIQYLAALHLQKAVVGVVVWGQR
jgi:hypothetical protein